MFHRLSSRFRTRRSQVIRAQVVAKRALDLTGALTGLVLLFRSCWRSRLIRLSSPGPILSAASPGMRGASLLVPEVPHDDRRCRAATRRGRVAERVVPRRAV